MSDFAARKSQAGWFQTNRERAAFLESLESMSYAQLKEAWDAAVIEDDHMGEPVMRPVDWKCEAILSVTTQRLADDAWDNENSDEERRNNADYKSAAKAFLERV